MVLYTRPRTRRRNHLWIDFVKVHLAIKCFLLYTLFSCKINNSYFMHKYMLLKSLKRSNPLLQIAKQKLIDDRIVNVLY